MSTSPSTFAADTIKALNQKEREMLAGLSMGDRWLDSVKIGRDDLKVGDPAYTLQMLGLVETHYAAGDEYALRITDTGVLVQAYMKGDNNGAQTD